MKASFDPIAISYDQEFTDTPIGRAQRDRVWRYLRQFLKKRGQARILELNCGTGEDAVFMAGLGHEVWATDISPEMLRQAQKKAVKRQLHHPIRFQQLDLANPVLPENQAFDLIFSNFGGLNCLSGDQLKGLSAFCEKHLNAGGACVFVVMPPKTLLEKGFRWKKGEMEIYQARSSAEGLSVRLGEVSVKTYFHSPSDMTSYFGTFSQENILPTGFIPSYLNKSRLLPFLYIFDSLCRWARLSANRADHYLIHLQKKA